MVWNGMEWNGMEWNGMEWNGMEWYGMEWNGMECNVCMYRERELILLADGVYIYDIYIFI